MVFFDRTKAFIAEAEEPGRGGFFTARKAATARDLDVIVGAIRINARSGATSLVILS